MHKVRALFKRVQEWPVTKKDLNNVTDRAKCYLKNLHNYLHSFTVCEIN
jgi:hypothetical protein